MFDKIIDIIGGAFWIGMFLSPFICIALMLKYGSGKKIYRILIGLLLSFFISFILYFLSLEIIFRDGMGPG